MTLKTKSCHSHSLRLILPLLIMQLYAGVSLFLCFSFTVIVIIVEKQLGSLQALNKISVMKYYSNKLGKCSIQFLTMKYHLWIILFIYLRFSLLPSSSQSWLNFNAVHNFHFINETIFKSCATKWSMIKYSNPGIFLCRDVSHRCGLWLIMFLFCPTILTRMNN